MSEHIYHLRNLTKVYDGRHVLHVEHLDIRQGEIFSVVGPSGAGKSTLLRLLNFLEAPSAGAVHFLDTEFSAAKSVGIPTRRRVTTVFQRPILLNRSVWDNVSYGLRLRGQRNASRLIEGTLDQVGLMDLAHQRARTLSGGEAQRVALARAMVLQPDALLLDEPTANLDPYNVGLIEDIVRALNREHGTTLVLVTHNVFQAKRLADRVALMLEGEMVEVADKETFFESPRDPRTAAFVRGEIVY
ncbi:MAG TPA: phosphate ABC transporter ATP-binding protein [Phycisphaerales bacterium]|nr:phosphate ABC transporter ATP-binding protein [Phycisphaerales bacterium]